LHRHESGVIRSASAKITHLNLRPKTTVVLRDSGVKDQCIAPAPLPTKLDQIFCKCISNTHLVYFIKWKEVFGMEDVLGSCVQQKVI
jgi:hypothetical protein